MVTLLFDTMVRMAQDFSMRYELVDGQGNFGSIDGDRAAAMRYTEVRMTRMAGEMLTDIDKDTISWQENYDGSEKEPTVLPAAIPNLLVNGSGGIAVGMATNMPPHNLAEVVTGTIAVLKNPAISFEELYEIIPGPDFPTGGFIFGKEGIRSAYETGRGIIRMRAKADFEYDDNGEEKAIIVHELPYQVNKARLLERIADLVRDKKIEGIRDLRDESDRRGMRIYIELKRGVMGQIVLNQLFTMTPMQSSFGIINLAIVGGQPRVLTLKELLVQFINHRRDVVTRRCRYELRKAQERAHILEGYLLALANIDEVVELIKASATPAEARAALRSRFELTEVQAQSILDMRLQRLTGLEVDKIGRVRSTPEEIKRLKAILADDDLLRGVIIEELERIKTVYDDPRRTQIINASGSIGMEDLIADEDMVVTITTAGYIKRTPLSDYRTQKRGGRGRSGMNTKSQDEVTNLFVASAHTLLMIFTDRGQVYPLKVWELPMGGINASGKAIVNLIPLEKEESIRSIVPVEDLDVTDQWLIFSTRRGVIKRTVLSQFKNVRNSGIRAINLDDGDDLIQVKLATADDKIMLVTAKGQSIIFDLDQARPMGRATRGTRGIRLRDDDRVVAMDTVRLDGLPDLEEEETEEVEEAPVEVDESGDESVEELDANESTIVLVTENGYGKRCRLAHFRVQKRGGLGLRALPYSPRNGELISMCQVRPSDDLMVVTDGGTIIRMAVNDVRTYSRYAKGVRVISVPKGEQVVSIFSVAPSTDEDDIESDELTGEGAEGTEAAENTSSETVELESSDTEESADDSDNA